MRTLLTTLTLLCLLNSARADLTLTIDTSDFSFTWSGVASGLETGTIGKNGSYTYRVAMGTSAEVGYHYYTIPGFVVETTGFDDMSIDSLGNGEIVEIRPTDTVYSVIAVISGSGIGTSSGTFTVTGTDTKFASYADIDILEKQFLSWLDGEELYFQVRDGLGSYQTIGAAIGTIQVVPEPSAYAFGFGGLAAVVLVCLRRRARR